MRGILNSKMQKIFKIGVIIPVHNSSLTLERCLNSLVDQTYKNFCVCCVNDNSSDDSKKIIEAFLNKYDFFFLINNNGSKHGPSAARNIGLSTIIGKCKYLTFIDSDDYVDYNYLENLIAIERQGCDAGCFSFYFSHQNFDKPFAKLPTNGIYSGYNICNYLLEGRNILSQSWGKIFNSKLWKFYRFPEQYNIYEDYAILYRIFLNCNNVLVSNYCGYHYWLDNSSTLRNKLDNGTVIKSIEASLIPYYDSDLDLVLKKSCLQFVVGNYLMMIPRIKRKELSAYEKKELKTIYNTFTRKIVRQYIPSSKKERKKKILYLFSKYLYIALFRFIVLKKNK